MTDIQAQSFAVTCADGWVLAGTHHVSAKPSDRVLLINSALGVPRRFYRHFAQFLNVHGVHVITFDYRGIGDSVMPPKGIQRSSVLMQHWGEQDIEAVLNWIQNQLHPGRTLALGHSCGGQLIGLAESCLNLDGILLIGSQLGDWRLWPFPGNLSMAAIFYALFPVASMGKQFPAKLFGVGRESIPAPIIRQWCQWGRSRDYLFNPKHELDISRYGKLSVPLLACAISDDWYAPEPNVKALAAHYSSTTATHRLLTPADFSMQSIGHFNYFRPHQDEVLWQVPLQWINQYFPHTEKLA